MLDTLMEIKRTLNTIAIELKIANELKAQELYWNPIYFEKEEDDDGEIPAVMRADIENIFKLRSNNKK